jgi:hypothetical protein
VEKISIAIFKFHWKMAREFKGDVEVKNVIAGYKFS